MADAVSKLYAEIGFKVNEDGLKQAQKMLTEFAKQMSAINELTKKQASVYGVFSKERAKQDTEREKQATEQRKAETQRIKQSLKETTHKQQLERMARKEEMQEKRFQQKEQEHLWRMEERSSKSHHTNMAKYAKQGAKSLVRIVRGTAKLLANATQNMYTQVVSPSLGRAIATRDFMMYTGTSLKKIQDIQERLVSVGSSMSQEEAMGEISSVMENISRIRFGEGKLSGFKLSGIQALAHKRDASGVLDAIEKATAGVSNQDLVFLLEQLGLSGQRWLPYFRARQRVSAKIPRLDDFQNQQLVEASTAINQLRYAFQKTSEVLTAKLSPAITSVVDKMVDILVRVVDHIDTEKFKKELDELAEVVGKILQEISPKMIIDAFRGIIKTFTLFGQIVEWIALKIGLIKKPQQPFVANYAGGGVLPRSLADDWQTKDMGKTIMNNVTLNQTINGVENEEMADKVKEAGKEMIYHGITGRRSLNNTYVSMVLAGD